MGEEAGEDANAPLDAATAEVFAAFAAGAVTAVLLRGPAVATLLYDDHEARPSGDVDVLVAPEDLDAAARTLSGVGFAEVPRPAPPHDRPVPAWLWRRRRDGVYVELHSAVVGVEGDGAVRTLLAETRPLTVGGVELPAPAEHVAALLVALHAAQEGPGAARAVEDLRRAAARLHAGAWERAAELARRVGAEQALASGLRLVEEGARVATRLGLPEVASTELRLRAAAPAHLRDSALALDWVASRPGIRAKVRAARSRLLPPTDVMRAWSPLARRGPAGLAAAHFARWARLGARAVPVLRAWRHARRHGR